MALSSLTRRSSAVSSAETAAPARSCRTSRRVERGGRHDGKVARAGGTASGGPFTYAERDTSQVSISGTLAGEPLDETPLAMTAIGIAEGSYNCATDKAEFRSDEGTWEWVRA